MKTPAPQRAASRKKLAAAKQALPDGSFPIPTVDYLKRAIRSVGRTPASKRPALAALIRKRAKQLNATNAPGVKGTWAFQAANDDTEALEMAMPARRMPVVRGAADVQLRRTAPGTITVQHKSSGMKVGTITPKGRGYAGTHATGTATGASGSQQGALAGLIGFHNAQAAKAKASAEAGAKTYTAGERAAVELVGPGGWSHGWIREGSPAHSELSKMSPARSQDVKDSLDKAHTLAERQPLVAGVYLNHALEQAKADPAGTKNLEKAITAVRDKVAAKPGGTYTKEDQQRNQTSAYWRKQTNTMGNRLNYGNGAREHASVDLAGSLPYTSNASSTDGPRITSMGSGKAAASSAPSGLSPYAAGVYKKLLAKKIKPAVALAMAKRAGAMHAKAA